ncbi:VRR-NUC domain-containing protein [Hymenobacter gelipurpurascens]|uniref:VRR-NUC domain-containing protein n=2 Tax=Hymenobacter gelipurpurascens TaxID=89968 RepID=A0A212T8L3_9BACT|nr:VRR-NUC domain-containing protein [Hymenobacter gelipurpurascens]
MARIIGSTKPTSRAPPDPDAPKPKRTRNTQATNDLTTAIRDLLTYEGCYIWRHNNAALYDPQIGAFRKGSSKVGLSDTLGFYRPTGHFVAVEVKYGTDTLKPKQREFLEQVRAAGGFACEGRSLEQVRREFNEWKQSITKSTTVK